MIIDDITINLNGKYDLSKLTELTFKRIHYRGDRYFYRLDGNIHRYTFIPIDDTHIRMVIRAKPSRKGHLDHIIAFGNFSDWIRTCVDTIQIGGIR